MMELHPSIFSN